MKRFHERVSVDRLEVNIRFYSAAFASAPAPWVMIQPVRKSACYR